MLSMLLMSVIMYFSPLLSISVTLTIGPSWPLLSLKVLLLLLMNRFDARVACDSRDSRDPRSHFARFAYIGRYARN